MVELCKLFLFIAPSTQYKMVLQQNPNATTFDELQATTKEIMFWQEKTLDEMVSIANTANYLDMPFVMDAACAAIALQMR